LTVATAFRTIGTPLDVTSTEDPVNLRLPGPTPVPPAVVEAGTADMINHRGPEFAALLKRTTEGVRTVFDTTNDLFILSASGSGGMEAAVVNHVHPDEEVLIVTIGVFGKRFVQICEAFGARPTELAFEFGSAADVGQIEAALQANPNFRSVLITHNETSTGTTNVFLPDVARVAHEHGCLLIVDAVSSLSSMPCPVDDWDLDVVVSGSQKGWMTAPGLSFVSVGERAWERAANNPTPRFYFDLQKAKDYLENGQTPWTPTISVFYQLDKGLEMMFDEGLDHVYQRHRDLARMTRDGMRALGLDLLAGEGLESETVTAVKMPDGVDGIEFLRVAREQFDTIFAGGQGPMRGQVFRFGHLGYVTPEHIEAGLSAVRGTLERLGYALPAAAG
jgi:aspartate aminotransferase-like enzyme